MKIETPAGARLGRVQDVVIDGHGRARFAIVSYGGVMGASVKYTAVPWAAVAEMLDRDRLLVERSNLENSPFLSPLALIIDGARLFRRKDTVITPLRLQIRPVVGERRIAPAT